MFSLYLAWLFFFMLSSFKNVFRHFSPDRWGGVCFYDLHFRESKLDYGFLRWNVFRLKETKARTFLDKKIICPMCQWLIGIHKYKFDFGKQNKSQTGIVANLGKKIRRKHYFDAASEIFSITSLLSPKVYSAQLSDAKGKKRCTFLLACAFSLLWKGQRIWYNA